MQFLRFPWVDAVQSHHRDVSTHWTSTAKLVQQALELSPALKILVFKAEHNKHNCGVHLCCFQLSLKEWKLLSDLSLLLDVSLDELFTFIQLIAHHI